MLPRRWIPLLAACLLLLASLRGFSQEKSQDIKKSKVDSPAPQADDTSAPKMLEIPFAETAPVIDGVLDDPIWQKPPLPLGDWVTYNPLYGNKMAQRTEAWAAYDKTGLYFAFRCLDHEPEKIKTTISRRDTIWNDDWVGISLDALGSHQSSYDLFVNPNGIQADILNSSTAGEDTSPDWVWESAGRRTDEGDVARDGGRTIAALVESLRANQCQALDLL